MTKTKADYLAFLKTPFWINLSRLKRRKIGCCEKCGSKKRLQCHHIFYRKRWEDTQESDLQVLCKRCHQKHHKISPPKITVYTRRQRHEWRMDYQKRMAARRRANRGAFV